MSDHQQRMQAIVEAADPKAAVTEHLASFLVEGEACRALFDQVMAQFKGARLDEQKLVLSFGYVEFDDEEAEVECEPPIAGSPDAPPSHLAFAKAHNGMGWESLGGGWFAFNGIDAESGEPGGGGWEYDALEEAAEDNEAFLKAIADGGKEPKDVGGIIDYGQNWVVTSPVHTNTKGEPALYFVSHGDCEAKPIDNVSGLGLGAVFLRVMAQELLGGEHLDECYS